MPTITKNKLKSCLVTSYEILPRKWSGLLRTFIHQTGSDVVPEAISLPPGTSRHFEAVFSLPRPGLRLDFSALCLAWSSMKLPLRWRFWLDLASSSPSILMCASKHKLRVWQLLPTAVSNCPMFYFLIIYVFCRQPVPAFNSTDYQHIVESLIDKYIEYISAAGKTFHNFPVITFRVRHSRGEIYIGHGRLCVCMSVCPSHHSHTRLTITRTQV